VAVNLLRCTDYSFEDPHQFAILDIIEVSRRNAPEREALRTYARVYANGEVYHYLRDKGFLIKVPDSWRELHVRGQHLLRLGMPAVELPKRLEVSAERRREIGEACGQQVVAMEVGEVDG
jgi:DNA-directed RNA polymerase specialized sigma subunit